MAEDKSGAAAAPALKVDPTGKYTLNGWGQTEADFAFFDLAQDKVELKSDGWRTNDQCRSGVLLLGSHLHDH